MKKNCVKWNFAQIDATIDNVLIIIQIFEKYYEHNTDLHNIFVDFTQAFDSVCKNKIKCLAQYKVPAKLVRLIGKGKAIPLQA